MEPRYLSEAAGRDGKPQVDTGYASRSLFTAAEIASTIGITPQALRKALARIPACGVKIVGGVEASAWSSGQIPERLQDRLRGAASRRGCRNIDDLLCDPPERWEPPLPLGAIREKDIEKARKLRDALRPWLSQTYDSEMARGEIEQRGVEDYCRVFGNRISRRYWRELFAMVLRRDGGAEDWSRLEVYLPKKPIAKQDSSRVVSEALVEDFREIESVINACRNPAAPSEIERRAVWRCAIEKHASLVGGGMPAKRAAWRVRSFLFAKASFLAPTRGALLKAFGRKLDAYKAKGVGALADGRENNGGGDFEYPQEDVDLIEAKIVSQYGQYDPAWREAWDKGELSEETRSHHCRRGARNRKMPAKLKSILGKRPLWLYTYHRRRRDFNSMKAHFDTIYDGLHTLDCISADDVTLPVWFWHQPDPNEPPVITRGQCLVFIDLVSKRIIGWSLQPAKNYNALVIYTQTKRLLRDKGLCRALLFEHGIWERSKLITGSNVLSVVEVTQGLKEFGIEFFHADSPEGKSEVERVMGLIQDLMEGEPGYCGRDERKDRPDWIKSQLSKVQSAQNPNGKIHPSAHFYSFEQWNARLGEIFEQYNARTQGGKHMRDRSPDDVYKANWNVEDPPICLGPELSCLLDAKYEVLVKPSGVSVTNGNRTYKYFGPELASLVGFKVLLWFDPEDPEFATVTDMKRNNPITVPLHNGVPRLERLTDPDGNRLAEACAKKEGQVSAMVARYNVLKDKFDLPYRKNLVAAKMRVFVQDIEQQKTAGKEKAGRKDRLLRQAKRMGISSVMVDDDPETQWALELLARAEREHQVARKQEPAIAHSYQLGPDKVSSPKPDKEGTEL